jgi:hypothetical protein
MVSEYNAALRQLQDSKSLKRSKYNPRAKYWPIDALFEKIRIRLQVPTSKNAIKYCETQH